jgi:hypothetical protein
MKKNKLLPILLLAGAGVAAYMYFKNKKSSKEIADGVDVEPIDNKPSSDDQTTTTSEETGETTGVKLIKSAASILKKGKQLIKGRKKRKVKLIIDKTQESRTPYPETDITRESRRSQRTTERTNRKTARKAKRTARRSSRKNKKVLTGFEF